MINIRDFDQPVILKEACEQYNIAPKKATLIRAYSNLIYDCGDSILRLTHPQDRNAEEVKLELDWVQYLHENDVDVATIILSDEGNLFEQTSPENHAMIAVCFEKIIGSAPVKETWNEQHFERLGKVTARMHVLARDFSQPERYMHWNETPKSFVFDLLPSDDRNLPALFQLLVDQFSQLPKTKDNYGIIHYDIHHGNYLIRKSDNKPVLFDFEMVCQNWFMMEAATVLYYANMHPSSADFSDFEQVFMDHFWKGYEQVYSFDKKDQEHIPKFLLYRDLLVFGYLHKIWDINSLEGTNLVYFKRISDSIAYRRKALKM